MKRLNEIGTAKKAVYSIFVFFWIFVAYSAHAVENCIDNSAQGFPCHNVDLLSYVSLDEMQVGKGLSLIHISEPTRPVGISRMPSSA